MTKCPNCKREYDLGELPSINCVCGAKVFNDKNIAPPSRTTPVEELEGYMKKFKIKEGDIVIDAGAYIGEFTVLASKLVGKKGKVISFEPNPNNYKVLLNEVIKNKITNVITINKGLWSENKTLGLSRNGMASTFIRGLSNGSVEEIPVVSLDNELKELGRKKVDFIKMDVEGAEIEAVKGCKETLKDNDVKLAIASYHWVNGQPTCYELEKLLRSYGYKAETLLEGQLLTYASKVKV